MFSSAAVRFEVPGVSSRRSVWELQIGGAGGNVPDLPAFLTSPAPRIDGISAMIVGFCAIFESS
jgi:hypothetical protein